MSAQRKRTIGNKSSAAAQRALRKKLAGDLGKVIAYLAPASASASSRGADFPAFVADLIAATFEAIVNASIEQMKAYGELLSSVAKSLDEFERDNVSAARARDSLADRYPELSVAKGGVFSRAARQQLLATMVLMGVHRIVVTDGRAKVPTRRSRLEGSPARGSRGRSLRAGRRA